MTDFSLLARFNQYMQPKKAHTAHAPLSASGSERWLGCPGSVRLCKDIPPQDTEWSVAGNHAHTFLQFILENPSYAWMLGRPEAKAFKEHIHYNTEMNDAVMVAVRYVQAEEHRLFKIHRIKPTLHIEKKVELKGVGFGTADIILYQPFGVLHVMDYKNGRGLVEAENNTQGLYYAYAAADLYGWDFSEVWITVIQPNANHKNGPIRTWKTTCQILEKAGKRFKQGAKATREKNAPLVLDTKWCWFCTARSICPKQMEEKNRKIMDRFKRG